MPKLISVFPLNFQRIFFIIMDILRIFQMQEPVLQTLIKIRESSKNKKVSPEKNVGSILPNTLQPIGEIFRMNEPVSKDLLPTKEEPREYQELLQEKDMKIKNSLEKIQTLEAEVEELKRGNEILEKKLKASTTEENSFQKLMINYDEFFTRIWNEREAMLTKQEIMEKYAENLECSFYELKEKFLKAKEIIYGMKKNQDSMTEKLEEYRRIVDEWEQRYEELKEHAETTIAVANLEIETKGKEHLEIVDKLNSKVSQREAKIEELQEMLKNETKSSIYAPLRNKIKNK